MALELPVESDERVGEDGCPRYHGRGYRAAAPYPVRVIR